jgi:hypothetical protein
MMAGGGWSPGKKPVSTAGQQLESFDGLSEADKHRAAVEILRPVAPIGEGGVPEAALVEAPDESLRALHSTHPADCRLPATN